MSAKALADKLAAINALRASLKDSCKPKRNVIKPKKPKKKKIRRKNLISTLPTLPLE